MKNVLKILAGLGVSAFFLWFALRGFDFANLKEAAIGLKVRYLVASFLIFSSVLSLRALRWKIVIDSMEKVPFTAVFPALAVGFLANNFLPARGGELVRAAALSRKTGISFAASTGSLIADRITDFFGLGVVMLIASRLLPWNRIPIVPVVGTAIVGIVGLYVAARYLIRLRPSGKGGLKDKVLSFAAKLGEGFAAIRSPSRVAALLAVSTAVWTLDAVNMMVMSHATGMKLSYTEATGLLVGIAAAVAIPASPGYVGTYEYFGKQVLVMLGHDATAALTFVVLLHFFQICVITSLGIPSLFLVGGKKQRP